MSIWFVNPNRRRGRRNSLRPFKPGRLLAKRQGSRTAKRRDARLYGLRQGRATAHDRAYERRDAAGLHPPYPDQRPGGQKNPRRRKKRRSAKQIAATKRMIAARKRATKKNPSRTRRRRKTTTARSSSMAIRKRKRRRARVAVANPRRRRRRSSKRRARRARIVIQANPRRRRRRRARASVANPRRRRRRRARIVIQANPRRRSSRRRGRRNPGKRRWGVRGLRKARRTIRYQKRYGSGIARRYMNRFRMRSNPGGGLKGVLQTVIPVVLAMGLGRVIAGKIAPRLPMLSSLGQYADPALSVGLFVLGHIATKKVKALGKYRTPILIGLGVNALLSAVKTLAPGVAAMVGLGDSGVYDAAMAGYQYDVGEYVQVGEMGEYVQVAGGMEGDAIEQLAGSGAPKMLAPVPMRAAVANVPDWTPGFSEDNLYTGVFANGMG